MYIPDVIQYGLLVIPIAFYNNYRISVLAYRPFDLKVFGCLESEDGDDLSTIVCMVC